MRAVVVAGPRRLAVENVPDPTPEPGQAVLRVAACGICGSDLHVHQLGYLPAGSILGHEFCGEVVEAAGGLRPGERVCALPVLSCGRCERCRRGLGIYCTSQRALGLGQAPGAFAEYVAVAPHEVVRLPPGVDDAHGALVEPLAVGLHAVGVSRLQRGESCLVIGAGPIGLAIALWARHQGAKEVIVSECAPGRRALAEQLGATRVVDPGHEDLGAVVAASLPGGADIVFEAVGARGLIQSCIEHVRFRGRIVVAGVCITPDTFHPAPAVLKEASLHFVMAYEKSDFERTVDLLERGSIEPRGMITNHIGLDAVPAAFEALERPTSQGKLIVTPSIGAT
jgi:(R,R)-butanediol dehydrogenase / meso-butanediol dehydrogenase / diacetyl reductase